MNEPVEEIRRLYESGLTNKSIALNLGLKYDRVVRILYKDLGLQSKNRPMKRDEINSAKQMRSLGIRRKDMAKKLNCSIDRIKRLLEA